jgi:hypothetical protein
MGQAYKLLGVHIPFHGSMNEHHQYLMHRSKQLQIAFNQLPLSPDGIILGTRSTIHPILSYSMAATTLDDKLLTSITQRLYHTLLPELGFNRHFQKVLITAPKCFGGIDLMDLPSQQGYAHLDTIVRHLIQQTPLSNFFNPDERIISNPSRFVWLLLGESCKSFIRCVSMATIYKNILVIS